MGDARPIARPRETTVTTLAPATTLTSTARAGDKVIKVRSSYGLRVGQRIRIGTGLTLEEATIAGFGSIVLETPLSMDHEPATAAILQRRKQPPGTVV